MAENSQQFRMRVVVAMAITQEVSELKSQISNQVSLVKQVACAQI